MEGAEELPINLDFMAMERGSVPIETYNKRDEMKSNLFSFDKHNDSEIIVKALKKPNLDYFSYYKIKEMDKLIGIYTKKWVTSKLMSDLSHKKIKAWDQGIET